MACNILLYNYVSSDEYNDINITSSPDQTEAKSQRRRKRVRNWFFEKAYASKQQAEERTNKDILLFRTEEEHSCLNFESRNNKLSEV